MNYFKKLPEELLLALFTYLDRETKLAVSKVCENWRNLIHHTSWKSISRLVEGDNTMKKEFSTFGWIETAEHEFGECRCIELHLGQHPFQNASLTKTYHSLTLCENYEAVVFQQSKLIGVEARTEEGIVTFHEIDFQDASPSWRKVQQKHIDFEESISTYYLRCCDKTLILMENKNEYSISWKAHITLWNTETWAFVCELPLEETSLEILKQKYEVSEENIIVDFLSIDVSSDFIVTKSVHVIGDDEHEKSLVSFWKHDALNPTDPPTFHTYILEEEWIIFQHLNAKYFCKRNSRVLQVFALDDIKNNNISKLWNVPALESGFRVRYSQLEGGQSNRLAVITQELKVYNIENGECVISLEVEKLFHCFHGEWNLSLKLSGHFIKFHLGKLILIQPLQRRLVNVTSTQGNFLVEFIARNPEYRYQIIIIDEKAKNQVVVGASLNSEADSKFYFAYGFYIGSKSLISLKKDSLNHWKVE